MALTQLKRPSSSATRRSVAARSYPPCNTRRCMKSKTISTCCARRAGRVPFLEPPQFLGQRFRFLLVLPQHVGIIDAASHQRGAQRRELIEPAIGRVGEKSFLQRVLRASCETASGLEADEKPRPSVADARPPARPARLSETSHGLPVRLCRLCESFRPRRSFRRRKDARLRQLYDAIMQHAERRCVCRGDSHRRLSFVVPPLGGFAAQPAKAGTTHGSHLV